MEEQTKMLIEKYINQQEAILEAEVYGYSQETKDYHIRLARGYRLALEKIFGSETNKAIEIYMFNKVNSHHKENYKECSACNGEGIYSHYDDCPGYLTHDTCGRCKGLGKISINK